MTNTIGRKTVMNDELAVEIIAIWVATRLITVPFWQGTVFLWAK